MVSIDEWFTSAEERFFSAEERFFSVEKWLFSAEEQLISANKSRIWCASFALSVNANALMAEAYDKTASYYSG